MTFPELFSAIVRGRTDHAIVLTHSDVHVNSKQAEELLTWCAYYGDTAAVRHLLSLGVDAANLGDNLGLGSAVFHGHWQLTEYLLEQGADANGKDQHTGESPLHAALCKANRPVYVPIIRLLLKYGADPCCSTLAGQPTGQFMRDAKTRGETPLHRAAAFASAEVIELLLGAGADKRAQDANGDTPLGWASWHLRPPVVLRLLCFAPHTIHPDNHASYDHGVGWGQMDAPQGHIAD